MPEEKLSRNLLGAALIMIGMKHTDSSDPPRHQTVIDEHQLLGMRIE
jgi:hypothetical protein